MMDWTDRHCRYLHRQFGRHALLHTEMLTAQAVIHGDRDALLGFHPAEHPVAVQLGGAEPGPLAQATRIAAGYGYDEVNLNVGCPSDRVQAGAFGAALMREPARVADCVAAMIAASPVPVTVKCRLGVDDQVPQDVLPAFLATVRAAGVRRVTIHARKAWLSGLSAKENREIPPLDPGLVVAMKRAFPDLAIVLNGGIRTLADVSHALAQGLDGAMVGRAAYHAPGDVLEGADAAIFGGAPGPSTGEVVDLMRPYIEAELVRGARLHDVTRHMLGLFAGRPGARGWRRILSEEAHRRGAGLEVVDRALAALDPARAAA